MQPPVARSAQAAKFDERGKRRVLDIKKMQERLREFAAERDWGRFHNPKNLAMAISVEAAELTEIFQWMSSDQAVNAHKNPLDKKRIADEVADVFLYLIQIADHAEIDLEHAVIEKIEKNAIKYPAN